MLTEELIVDKKCPFCNGEAKLTQAGDGLFYKYSCDCGLTSKLFSDKWVAKEWFNSRGGKPCAKKYRRPEIEHVEVKRIVSGVELTDGKVERTTKTMGVPVHPQAQLDEIQKEAEKPRPF